MGTYCSPLQLRVSTLECLDTLIQHLYFSRKKAIVLAGSVDRSHPTEGQQVFFLNSEDFKTHPEYDRDGIKNDITLLHLPQKINYTENIQPVKLLVDDEQTYKGKNMTVSGFGQTDDQSAASHHLRYTNLKVISNFACSLYYTPGLVESSKICCDSRGPHSTCQGDSGGPLVLEGTYYLVGLTSFGGGSCEKGTPVVFTRVSAHKEFLENHLGPL